MLSKHFESEMMSNEIGHPRRKKFTKWDIAVLLLAIAAGAFAIWGMAVTAGK